MTSYEKLSDDQLRILSSYHKCCDWLFKNLPSDYYANCFLHSEESLFVRFNNSRVRQNMDVDQSFLKILLITCGKNMTYQFNLSGDESLDLTLTKWELAKSLKIINSLKPQNINIKLPTNGSSTTIQTTTLNPHNLIEKMSQTLGSCDWVGLFSFGPIIQVVRNNFGLNHVFINSNFTMDYSLFSRENAVKGIYTDSHYNSDDFTQLVTKQKIQLEILKQSRKTINPGSYPVYFSSTAVSEIMDMLSWGALSERSYRQGQCAFKKLRDDPDFKLSDKLNIQDNFSLNFGPAFNQIGELSPNKISLINNGRFISSLISNKSSEEYGVPSNQADDSESPRSLDVAPGSLKESEILKTLDTGLYISDLHYLNWSNLQDARITGMTRFACFWVENGQIQSPIKDIRFDESLFTILGSGLVDLTEKSEAFAQRGTYFHRHLGGKKTPGMLVKGVNFTL